MSARMDRLEFYREVVDLEDRSVPGDWRWSLVAVENGKTIGASTESYRRRIDAVRNASRVLGLSRVDLAIAVIVAAQDGPQEYRVGERWLRVVVKP